MEEIFEKISENINQLEQTQKDRAMLQIALYQKKIEKVKDEKIKSLEKYFQEQLKYYGQTRKNYEKQIEEIINKYEEQINRLIAIYDNLYLTTFKLLNNAQNNQVIAIANIVTAKNEDKEDSKKLMNACAKKKINYSVIVDECIARINWIIENAQKDIEEVFITQNLELEPYKNNVFLKIRNKILNILFGKTKFKDLLDEYEQNFLKKIGQKNSEKIFETAAVLNGISKQMNIVKEQIDLQYIQMIN